MKRQALTVLQHDEIARIVHSQLSQYGPTDSDQVSAWQAVRALGARLCAEFDGDPGFDYARFISLYMTGKAPE